VTGHRGGPPPGKGAAPAGNGGGEVERLAGGSDAVSITACPYCSIVYVRVNRRARRQLARLGKQPGE
jgi:hypothetical protein